MAHLTAQEITQVLCKNLLDISSAINKQSFVRNTKKFNDCNKFDNIKHYGHKALFAQCRLYGVINH